MTENAASGIKIEFGTDGWRGLLDSEINQDTVAAAAQAFALYLKNKAGSTPPRAAIGYDGRRNSRAYAMVFARVLSGNGISALLSESVVPTPAVSFYVKARSLDAGVMITASHNPPAYNGIKFKAGYGGPFFTEETRKVEELLWKSPAAQNDQLITQTTFLPVYTKQLEQMIDFEAIRRSGIAVLVDSMSGAGQRIIEQLLLQHGCRCKTIYGTAEEGFSNRLAEPIEKNLLPLREALTPESVYAFGAATDGDADRCGILYDDGTWMSAQETILLLADYMINGRGAPGSLVKTSSVTAKLEQYFGTTVPVHDVQVGFKYICEKMIEGSAAFGAEESGGFGYYGHMPERDGMLTALIFAEMVAKSGCATLGAYAAKKRERFGSIYYDRIDYHYTETDRTERLPALSREKPASIAGFTVRGTQEFYSSRGVVNGMKFLLEGNTRWLLLRCSETEPMFRIYAEGERTAETALLLDAGKQLITDNQL